MGRKVKCRFCGESIDKDTAYAVLISTKNAYYCNEEEYKKAKIKEEEKKKEESKTAIIEKYAEECLGVFDLYISINTKQEQKAIKDTIKKLRKTYSEEQINWVLDSYLGNMIEIAERKNIKKDIYRLKYILAILVNNFAEYITHMPTPRVAVDATDFYMPEVQKYRPRPRPRGGAEIEKLGEEDEIE